MLLIRGNHELLCSCLCHRLIRFLSHNNARSIISLGEFRTDGGGCWIEVPRHSVPISVRKYSSPRNLRLSASSGVLLHTVPASWSAVPLLSLCQASFFFSHASARWSPRTWSPTSKNPSEHPNFPSSSCCMHIYQSQILLCSLWTCLSSACGIED